MREVPKSGSEDMLGVSELPNGAWPHPVRLESKKRLNLLLGWVSNRSPQLTLAEGFCERSAALNVRWTPFECGCLAEYSEVPSHR